MDDAKPRTVIIKETEIEYVNIAGEECNLIDDPDALDCELDATIRWRGKLWCWPCAFFEALAHGSAIEPVHLAKEDHDDH